MKKIIVTGGLGFIGSNLIELLLKKNYYVINIDKVTYSSNFYNTKEFENNRKYKFIKCDINDKRIEKIFNTHKPVGIFNLAAETHVDRSIDSPKSFIDSNIMGVYNILEIFKKFSKKNKKTRLIHISTDYVFEGTGQTPWHRNDPTAPQNAYGRSKLAGENGIRASGAVHAILRTSWVVSAHGTNFVKTMLRLSRTRDALNIVADQIGAPTPGRDIAAACLQIANQLIQDPSKSGTYHFSGTADVSWAEFAAEIFDQAGRSVTVTPIPTVDYPTPAVRPLNSRMDCSATEQAFGIVRPCWRTGLNTILKDLNVIT